MSPSETLLRADIPVLAFRHAFSQSSPFALTAQQHCCCSPGNPGYAPVSHRAKLPRASSCRFLAQKHHSTLLPILVSAASQLQPPTSVSAFLLPDLQDSPRDTVPGPVQRENFTAGRAQSPIPHCDPPLAAGRPPPLTLNEFPPAAWERKVGAGTRPSAAPQSAGQVHEPPPGGWSQRVWRVRRSDTAPRRSEGPPTVGGFRRLNLRISGTITRNPVT